MGIKYEDGIYYYEEKNYFLHLSDVEEVDLINLKGETSKGYLAHVINENIDTGETVDLSNILVNGLEKLEYICKPKYFPRNIED